MGLGHRTLMVTQNGDHAIGVVVGIQLLLHSPVHRCSRVKLFLEGDRCVVCTEHLRCETLHVRCQMLVQGSRLEVRYKQRTS